MTKPSTPVTKATPTRSRHSPHYGRNCSPHSNAATRGPAAWVVAVLGPSHDRSEHSLRSPPARPAAYSGFNGPRLVRAAGVAERDIPMFVNTWLNADSVLDRPVVAGGKRPGDHPSGGPSAERGTALGSLAPILHLIAPRRMYVDDAEPVATGYHIYEDEYSSLSYGPTPRGSPRCSRPSVATAPGRQPVRRGKVPGPDVPESHALTDVYGLQSAAGRPSSRRTQKLRRRASPSNEPSRRDADLRRRGENRYGGRQRDSRSRSIPRTRTRDQRR